MATSSIVAENETLTAQQQARVAEFAKKERERAEEIAGGAVFAPIAVSGSGTTTYSITMSDSGSGVALLSWSVSSSKGEYVIGNDDWVGVFTNASQALSDPSANYLGGSKDWEWTAKASSYKTTIKLQPGQVAAYVVKDSHGHYKSVAITSPYPLG